MNPVDDLPTITKELPGIGGRIKQEPAHFLVEEVPLYEPIGQGEHVYVNLTREGWNTHQLQREIANLFGINPRDVGIAGRKDRQARVTQTFSLLLLSLTESEVAERLQSELPIEVHWVRRHRNKLKPGHLKGNRFTVQIVDCRPGFDECVEPIRHALLDRGLPNFYGGQRFGMGGDNAIRGREILVEGARCKKWLRRLLLSAYQSALFNTYLVERIEHGWFDRLVVGDVAKKIDTGGIFEVEDIEREMLRFDCREITFTGPIYGSRMRWAGGEVGSLERRILEEAGVTEAMLKRARLDGSRRPARLFLDELEISTKPDGLVLNFFLPKGAYATVLLREFVKSPLSVHNEES